MLAGFVLFVLFLRGCSEAAPAFAAVETTTIVGKVIMPNGVVASAGTVRASLSTQGGTPDGAVVNFVGGSATSAIASDGSVTAFALVPNDAITPVGTSYDVTFDVTAPIRTSWTVRWSVTSSPDPIDIGSVTRLDVAPGLSPMTCMNFLSAQFNPIETSAGFVSLAGGEPVQNATESVVDDVITPFALRFSTMRALVDVAPDNGAGTQGWTLTLRSALASTAVTCSITEAETSCAYSGAAVAIAAGTKLNLSVDPIGLPMLGPELLVSVCAAP